MRNNVPKPFIELNNKPIIIHTYEKFEKKKEIDYNNHKKAIDNLEIDKVNLQKEFDNIYLSKQENSFFFKKSKIWR